MYWSGVARPGEQIDTNVSSSQLPPQTGATAYKPTFQLHTTDFWAQGLNVGLDFHF
jgi:hypothetical protein